MRFKKISILILSLWSSISYANFDFTFSKFGHTGNQTYFDKNNSGLAYNDTTTMISYSFQNIKLSYFKNSYFKDTYYVGYDDRVNLTDEFSFGYSIGISQGYYLRKIFQNNSFIRKAIYNDYDGWDQPILPLGYLYLDYKINKNISFGGLLFGKSSYGIYINYNT